MDISERQKKILSAVVEQYVKTGEPVGSKLLMDILPFSVSSATIRNEMSELSRIGFLAQPHTSAGRIPTQSGYRYYIDNLMNENELDDEEKRQIRVFLGSNLGDPESLLGRAGEILARLTNCATVATTPTDMGATVKRVELVPVGSRIAMVVLMTSTGIIKNGVCKTDVPLTAEMRETFSSIVEREFKDKPLTDITMAAIQTLVASLGDMALVMSPIFVVFSDLANQAVQAEVRLEGRQNLLNHKEFSENAYEMLDFLTDDDKLARVMSTGEKEMQVLIGQENMFRQLENTSLIISRYSIQGHDGGSIGIIGPTRIDYKKLIPRLRYISELVGTLLTDTLEDDI